MIVKELSALQTEYGNLLGECNYAKFADYRKILEQAGGLIVADTKPGYRGGAIGPQYTDKDHAIHIRKLLDFVATTKGPIYEIRGYEDECSVFFKEAPKVDFTKEVVGEVPETHTAYRPSYVFDFGGEHLLQDLENDYYALDEAEQAELVDSNDGEYDYDYGQLLKRKYGKDVDHMIICTHDGFEVEWDKLEKFARSNNPVAVCMSSIGSSSAFVLVQAPRVLPSFKLVNTSIALPGASAPSTSSSASLSLVPAGDDVTLPKAGKYVSKGIQDRWESRMEPLLKDGKGVTEYMEKYGKGISPAKLKELAQVAVNSGQLDVAKDLLREAKKLDEIER